MLCSNHEKGKRCRSNALGHPQKGKPGPILGIERQQVELFGSLDVGGWGNSEDPRAAEVSDRR